MTSGRIGRIGIGAATVAVAGLTLTACNGGSDSSGQAPATVRATSSAATAPATGSGAAATSDSGPATTSAAAAADADPCATATKTALEAALRANKQITNALEIDNTGLHDIKCADSFAVATFSNSIDGGQVVFQYKAGAWAATDGGTGICDDDVPAAADKQLCG